MQQILQQSQNKFGFYFIRGTTRLGYGGTIMNLQIVFSTKKFPT